MRQFAIIIFLSIIMCLECCCYSADNNTKPLYTTVSSEKQENLTPFPNNERMRKIIKRNELQHEGYMLAKYGKYEEALEKYKLAMDVSLLNEDNDKAYSLWPMINIYEKQGKFDDALQLHEKYLLPINPNKDTYIDKRLELVALIKARDTKNNKPIYDFVDYIKTKYGDYIPPKGYAITYESKINDLIHLYDYLHDYDSGIAFMDEIIDYHTKHPDKNHRSAHAKDVAEYTRVKQAWELDKQTGQHGHLQEVIKTSDVISW